MKFSWSTHLCLYLETLTSIIRTGLPILVELIDLVNSVIIFLSQTTLLRWLTFLFGSLTVILTIMLFWISFFLLMLVFVLQWLSLHCKILIMLLSQFPLAFHHIHNKMPLFIALHMTILLLIGIVFDHLRDVPWEDIFKLKCFCCCLRILWARSGWNWCIYLSPKISGQASPISMVFSCLCYWHSS